MSHSKQTANYGLPLFEPKDRPAWLTDFNGAMTAVDATVKGLADSIEAGGLPVTGGTMQGNIDMGDHAITNVQEVELQGSGDGLYIGSVVQPNGTSGARMTGVAGGSVAFVKPDSQSIYVPVLVGAPSQDKHAATKEYVDNAIENIPASGITQEQADARYLQLSGGTMAGDLKVQESPPNPESAVSKSYAQSLFGTAVNQSVPKAGGTMSGPLILSGAPTEDNQAATKAYVDANSGGIQELYVFGSNESNNWNTVTTNIIANDPPFSLLLKTKYLKLEFDVTDWGAATNVTLAVKFSSDGSTVLSLVCYKTDLNLQHFEAYLPISLLGGSTTSYGSSGVSWAGFTWYFDPDGTRDTFKLYVKATRSGSGTGAGTYKLSLWG